MLDALGIAKAHVVGNSFGGAIALAMAIRHPEILLEWIDRSQPHVFGRCGHWVQIERAARFARLLDGFFAAAE